MFLYSCEDEITCEDDPSVCVASETLAGLMAADPNLSQLIPFIEENATLAALVDGSSEYTFFAPSNEAFDVLKATLGVSDLTLVRKDVIGAVLAFHFASGSSYTDDLIGSSITSTQGEDVVFNADGTILTGGSNTAVNVVSTTKATNGVMHIVDRVLIPPSIFGLIGLNLGKLSQPIYLLEMFKPIDEAILKADEFAASAQLTTITSLITGTAASFTMFLPTDGTFTAGGLTTDSFTGQEWYGIISNHMVPALVTADEVVNGAEFPTLFTVDGVNFGSLRIFMNTAVVPADNGTGAYFDSNGDVDMTLQDGGASLANLDGEFVQALLTAESDPFANGIVHIIAGVLAPPTGN